MGHGLQLTRKTYKKDKAGGGGRGSEEVA